MTPAATLVDVRMPSLGADMTEGQVVEWCVGPGDHVERGDIVAVVHTDKSDIEIEVFEPGTVAELVVDPGVTVPVGTTIARMVPATSPAAPPAATAAPAPPRVVAPPPVVAPQPVVATPARVASPILRHLAEDAHVDLRAVTGSGRGGRITRDDIERSAHEAPTMPRAPLRVTPRARRLAAEAGIPVGRLAELATGGRTVTGDDVHALVTRTGTGDASTSAAPAAGAPDAMRTRIASLMSQAWREIPHYHLERRLDLSSVLDGLRTANEQRPITERLLPAAVLLAAAARAARAVPGCNGWWRDDRFEPASRVDLGVILSMRSGGIVAPTITGADELDVDSMMARLRELVDRARRGRLRGSDLGEAGISVTNLGDAGADVVYGVIHPPQVALVGFGAVHDDLWVVDGGPCVRPTVRASLAGDHRATDGLTGSAYLRALQDQLDAIFDQE